MLFLRSIVYWLILVLSTLIGAIVLVCFFPTPFKYRLLIDKAWIRINLLALKTICRLDYQVTGLENLPDTSAIFLSKHQSAWETIAFQEFLPPLSWVLKRELLWIPFFGWGLACMEPIAIDRKAGRKAMGKMIEQGSKRLAQDRWLMIFPEGTRTPPKQKGHYHTGGGLLARKTGSPIIPIAHNAGLYWPRRGLIKHPGTIQVIIGPCMPTTDMTAKQITQMAEDWIEQQQLTLDTLKRPD